MQEYEVRRQSLTRAREELLIVCTHPNRRRRRRWRTYVHRLRLKGGNTVDYQYDVGIARTDTRPIIYVTKRGQTVIVLSYDRDADEHVNVETFKMLLVRVQMIITNAYELAAPYDLGREGHDRASTVYRQALMEFADTTSVTFYRRQRRYLPW